MHKGMARNDPQVNLRMPADLKDRLDAAAEENKRSLTAEVVARLEESFGDIDVLKDVAREVVTAKIESEAVFDAYRLVVDILRSASGNDEETRRLIAEAVRSLKSTGNTDVESARKAAIERLAQALSDPLLSK